MMVALAAVGLELGVGEGQGDWVGGGALSMRMLMEWMHEGLNRRWEEVDGVSVDELSCRR